MSRLPEEIDVHDASTIVSTPRAPCAGRPVGTVRACGGTAEIVAS